MPTTLFISALSASFGARGLFDRLTLTVAPGDVVAVVGPNGAGKSTLFRIIVGEHEPDAGGVQLSPAVATIGYLPQDRPDPAETILAYAARRTGVTQASEEFDAATRALASGLDGADERYARVLDRWLALGGGDLEVRLAQTVARLGLAADLDAPLGELSGGQAARASLATILVSQYDVLCLDEPTNNLDADGLALLTEFVTGCRGPVLVTSHDRAFLDAVATLALEIDATQQTVTQFAGGWSDYRVAKDLGRRQAESAYADYAARRDDLVEQARRKAEWASRGRATMDAVVKERGTPRVDRKPAEDAAGRLDRAAARSQAAIDRLDVVEQPRKKWQLQYTIAEAPPSAEVALTLSDVVARAGSFAVGPVSAQVARGDRVALAGPNGSGKTTLLRAILGEAAPASGRISWGTRVSIGVLDQDRGVISGEAALVDAVGSALGWADRGEARTLLAKFGLGAEHVERPCSTLSLGERTRAALAVLQGRAVNVVILDEPTNHLDVEAIEQLEAALAAFGGTLIVVTHDIALTEALGITTSWTFCRRGDTSDVVVSPA